MVILILAAIIFALVYMVQKSQTNLKIHVPPDLSRGATLRPGELQKPNAYAFALYVWKGLNEWMKNGKDDYAAAIDKYQCLITPDFEKWLQNNKDQKARAGELDRTRFLSELNAYTDSFVADLGNNTFSVAAVMQLQERFNGMLIKDTSMSYSMRVVPDNRKCNEMGMALDGFMVDPTRAETEAEEKSRRERGRSH